MLDNGHRLQQEVTIAQCPRLSIKENADSVSVSVLDEFDVDNIQSVISVLGDIEKFLMSI